MTETEQLLQLLPPDARLRTTAAGCAIGLPKSVDNQVLLLLRGRIRVFLSNRGREVTLSYLSPGSVFATHTRAYLLAEEDCEYKTLSTAALLHSARESPQLLASALGVLGHTLHHCIDVIENYAFMSVEERLIRHLLQTLQQRTGEERPSSPAVVELGLTGS